MVVVKPALKVVLADHATALRRHAEVVLHKAHAVIDKNAAKETLMVQRLIDSTNEMTGPMTGPTIAAMTGPRIAPMSEAWTEPTIAARAATSCLVTSTPS